MPSRNELANAVRAISMDAVQKAESGHPGAPMGMADIAEVLWNDYLNHNPTNPNWVNRDRFVLSNGHGSMLIYSLLHLSGYDLPMDEIKNFRQLHSKTPGHPEYGYTPGIETTTGPLGQGISNAVGMAIAEKVLGAQFNTDKHTIVDHNTYVFLGDGCMMEGVSHEACSLAGTLGLGKLVAFWDDNGISIDGHVEGWFTDDTGKRFEAYGWNVIRDVDGHNADSIKKAIEKAKSQQDKPTLICCKTVIGFGSPNLAGSHDCHGAPLGPDEIAATREKLKWKHAAFEIPDDIYAGWNAREKGQSLEAQWNKTFAAYKKEHADLAAEFERRSNAELPSTWQTNANNYIKSVNEKGESKATRQASQAAINGYAPFLPEMLGGSADLTGSNNTNWKGTKAVSKDNPGGNYIHYGVREFGMGAIMNGITLHGGFIPYGGTFLVFSDYARNSVRMSALMKIQSIFVFTHDSIGLGEDGPTHQPVEHVTSLRIIPNLDMWRPCDMVETAVAWKVALEKKTGPSCFALTRQGLPHQTRTAQQINDIPRGGYILKDCKGDPQCILLATGSEVGLAMEAANTLQKKGINTRVVSMPCTSLFDAQDDAYKTSVLSPNCKARVAIEAGVSDYWYKYVGLDGKVIGIDRFGESAPAKHLFKFFGLTSDNIVKTVEGII